MSAAGGLATLLETPGAQVRRAANGAEALLHGLKPDLALLDRDKSQIDGFELAARLHATPRHRAACPVAVTGCGPLTTSVRLRSAGFDRCMIKPIVEHEVHQLMELGARGGR